jgi:hypothetical protein
MLRLGARATPSVMFFERRLELMVGPFSTDEARSIAAGPVHRPIYY